MVDVSILIVGRRIDELDGSAIESLKW